MSFSLSCKTALVTGAGRGIGRAIARKLAAAGANVMVNDLDESALLETEDDFRKSGYKVEHSTGDLTDPSTPDKLVQATLERFGSLDIIVNNAGYSWDGVIRAIPCHAPDSPDGPISRPAGGIFIHQRNLEG